jgi:hypothetical protein
MSGADPAPPLRETQRRLRALITAASGSVEAREADALLRGDPPPPAGVRLDVYAHAWFARIHGVLASDFGALAQVLGEEDFRALARAYLTAHPPQRPSLRDAGAELADFLAAAPAAAGWRERHPFAPDLARLEWALVEAFDAADAPVLPREALAALPPGRWPELRLVFQPALRRLALGFPVQRLRSEHDAGAAELPGTLAPQPTQLCVWRRDERVFHRALDPPEAAALELACHGASFGQLCETLAARLGEAEAPPRAAALLARWQQDGWLAALDAS